MRVEPAETGQEGRVTRGGRGRHARHASPAPPAPSRLGSFRTPPTAFRRRRRSGFPAAPEPAALAAAERGPNLQASPRRARVPGQALMGAPCARAPRQASGRPPRPSAPGRPSRSARPWPAHLRPPVPTASLPHHSTREKMGHWARRPPALQEQAVLEGAGRANRHWQRVPCDACRDRERLPDPLCGPPGTLGGFLSCRSGP